MIIRLSAVTLLVAALFGTWLPSASVEAAPLPVLAGDTAPELTTLVGHARGGRGGGGRHAGGGRGGGGKHARGGRGGGGGGGKKAHGGGGGAKHAKGGRGHGGAKKSVQKRSKYGYYARRKRPSHYRYFRGYPRPYFGYGSYSGGCGWLYRRAVATGSRYWWNRYYECVGYY